MKAVGFYEGGALTAQTFNDLKVETPIATNRDILVEISAVSVNPVDTKIRQATKTVTDPKILGFDAVGKVVSIGSEVKNFNVGDRVYYAGSNQRAGSNQDYQLVDERLVSLAPQKLLDEQVAAMPLTMLTAYEMLFEKFQLTFAKNGNSNKRILIINGAGGVGSSAIQLAKWAGLEVITTASRPESVAWVQQLGADIVLDHHQDLASQLPADYIGHIDDIMILHTTEPYFEQAAQLIQATGHIGSIVETVQKMPLNLLKDKAVSFDWEFMFAKAKYGVNMASQGQILSQLARLFDQEEIKSTVTQTIKGLTAEHLFEAHQLVEKGQMIGKLVIVK